MSFALGLWLAVSPWIVGYEHQVPETANAAFVGIALALGAHFQIGLDELWTEWLNFAVGLWLLAAPFALEFSGTAAMVNCVAVGCLGCALAASALHLDKEMGRIWQRLIPTIRP
ncbi:hypothetical protein AYO46_07880 [Betaproteobacteria bacterium SCGC AG-212-J23]|nr:hypothetical protein AYO46_07880 [Betaproteobacteria bacterium SCGC AG-212-J23]